MMILYFLFIPTVYFFVKSIIYIIVRKFGKFSYDGFSAAGFVYNSEKNIFYSARNAWQKNFGYCHFYDVSAPMLQIIIDTEPVKFYYRNKNWLIVFWKGQYGITTGGEVGIYSTTEKKVNKKTIYMPASDDELLDISFTLYKKGEKVQEISAKHWWCAMFKIGMFSKPKELSMDISLTFPNAEMMNAFLESFRKLRYKAKDYKIVDNTFSFTYKKPHTRKVWSRMWIFDIIRQHYNKKNVKLYNAYLSDVVDDNMIDDSVIDSGTDYIMLKDIIPDILKNGNFDKKNNQSNIVISNNISKNVIFLNSSVSGINTKDNYEK